MWKSDFSYPSDDGEVLDIVEDDEYEKLKRSVQ
jgi:hypothetical protein